MPKYTFNHVHHETKDVNTAVTFYKDLFGATADPAFERGGATWVPVHIGNTQITVTDRDFSDMELGRYQGLDHFALTTDDFDATLADIEKNSVSIWMGPVQLENGMRIVFINGPDNIKIELMENI
jgi:predicted enzyme related to lactoylglutathione lyase